MRAAVVGLGRMGAEPSSRLEGKIPEGWLPISHIESIITTDGLDLLGVCDANEERSIRMAEYYSVKDSFTEYEELIRIVKPEFLSIATRTKGRSEIIKAACESGTKIIYAEKPLCNSLKECDEIMESVAKHKVRLGYGVNRRYHSVYRKALALLNSGEFGELCEITVEHGHSTLFWTHPHSTDIILFFAGSTDLLTLQGNCSFGSDYSPENHLFIDADPLIDSAFFTFKNGISATITKGIGFNTRLSCSKGMITIYSDGESLEIRSGYGYRGDVRKVSVNTPRSATQTAFSELIDLTLPAPISLNEIRTGLLMLNGVVYSSLHEGRRISPDEVPLDMVITGKSGNFYA